MDTTQRKTITLQPAQGATPGAYDPRQPLPYPWHIGPDGNVERQDFWRGDPRSLIGFQRDADVQRVDVFAYEWVPAVLRGDRAADEVVGMFPVFARDGGSMWSSTRCIERVSVNG